MLCLMIIKYALSETKHREFQCFCSTQQPLDLSGGVWEWLQSFPNAAIYYFSFLLDFVTVLTFYRM